MTDLSTTDFVSSFKKGQENADISKRAREEVFTTIDEAASQLEDATRKRLKLAVYKKPDPYVTLGELLSSSPLFMNRIQEKELIFVIGASNPAAKTSPRYLASFQFASQGYPCTLSWLKTVRICDDKNEFEDSLKSMLEDPRIGEELRKVVEDKAPENANTPEDGRGEESSDG